MIAHPASSPEAGQRSPATECYSGAQSVNNQRMRLFDSIAPTQAERRAKMPGDAVVAAPDVVLDRGLELPVTPEALWPWLVQLGKERGGWYLPAAVERWIPTDRRGLRVIDIRFQSLAVGSAVPDWGGPQAEREVILIDPSHALVYRSQRGRMPLSWAIVLSPAGDRGTRLHVRLRLGNVRRRWLAQSAGELVDRLTIAGLASGLRERLG
jgi:hypothetical protein